MVKPPEGKVMDRLEVGVLYGFRALMVLFVANFHIWQQDWLPQYFTAFGTHVSFDYFTRSSYLFVDGMLLLSGFLLFLPYARNRADGTSIPGVKHFYINRLIRIVPSYVLAVLVALFCFALPLKQFSSVEQLWTDLLSHLTFTLTFFKEPYLFTKLNGVLWTVAIEMQFYLIFPLLARAARKRPAITFGLMACVGWVYRFAVAFFVQDTSMFINQLPSFMDVYALGMLGAMAFMQLRHFAAKASVKQKRLLQAAAVFAFVGSIMVVLALLQVQSTASINGVGALRLSQMNVRLPLALSLIICMLSATQMPAALCWLLSNRLMRFLSTISFNLYICHQFMAVEIARNWFPDTLHSDFGLQCAYTLLIFSASIIVAMLATFGWEQPIAKLANVAIQHFGRKKDHERSPSRKTEPSADPLFVRAEKRRKGTD